MSERRGLMTQSSGGSTMQVQTGTFLGSGVQDQTIICLFEPDVIFVYGEKPAQHEKCENCLIIIRDTVQMNRYYSVDTNTSSTATAIRNGIVGLDEACSQSYTYRPSYSNGVLTLHSVTNARTLFASDIEYTYKLIKW